LSVVPEGALTVVVTDVSSKKKSESPGESSPAPPTSTTGVKPLAKCAASATAHGSPGLPHPKIASRVGSGNSSTIVTVCGVVVASSCVYVIDSPLATLIMPGVNRTAIRRIS
jgi:hypothetical protein